MYCLRVNVTSPRQIPMHILMSLANKLPCILVYLEPLAVQRMQRTGCEFTDDDVDMLIMF